VKTFSMMRGGRRCTIVELGFRDFFWLLLGRELPVMWFPPGDDPMVIRAQPNYDAFNLDAIRMIPGDPQSGPGFFFGDDPDLPRDPWHGGIEGVRPSDPGGLGIGRKPWPEGFPDE